LKTATVFGYKQLQLIALSSITSHLKHPWGDEKLEEKHFENSATIHIKL
jgi:hypothetical protein